MYIAIDVGGTKTLLAVLSDEGVIVEELKFPTPKTYEEFLSDLKTNLENLKNTDFKAGGLAVPASSLDRAHGIGRSYGNLPWRDTPIQHDLEQMMSCPFVVENDAKLAGLSEAMLLKTEFSRVMYVTVSTGIGYGLVVDCVIDPNLGDGGGRTILLDHDGKLTPWEDFASGKAIVERYGKKAKDINDEETWKRISADLAKGLIELIAITEPEAIVIGGSVGNYFEKFGNLLKADLDAYAIPLLAMPKLLKAQRPDEAVVFGCYDLAKQVYSS